MSTPAGFFGVDTTGSRNDQEWPNGSLYSLWYRYIGVGQWVAVPKRVNGTEQKYIGMTGAAVTSDFAIPKVFRLVKVVLKHTVAAGTDGTDAAAWTVRVYDDYLAQWETLYADTAVTASDTVVSFGKGFEFPVGAIRVIGNTTNTDRLYPSFYLQEVRRDL